MPAPPRYGSARYGSGVRYTSASTLPATPSIPTTTRRSRPHPMNDDLTNRLNMIGACLDLADSTESRAVWDGHPPVAFGTGYTALAEDYAAVIESAPSSETDTTGTTEAKASAERILEDRAYRMARALVAFYRSTGDLTNLGKVNVTRSSIVRLRHQALTTRTTEILGLAKAAALIPAAADFAIGTPRITALTTAIDDFEGLRNAPRSATAARGGQRDELVTQVADLVESVRALDDLVLQFEDSPAARTFASAWTRARIVVDAGHGPGEPPATPPPATPPTP